MAKKTKELTPPKGVARLLYRTPIWIYRLGLGGLLGDRFLLLNHIGRKTGLPRQAVLEVVRHDKDTDTFIVAAGFGARSQWYQNILKTPQVSIQVGRRKIAVTAEPLPPEQAGQEIADFARRYPREAKMAGWLGYEVDGTEEDYYQAGTMMMLVALRPR